MKISSDFTSVLITGGAGYVGSALVPALLKSGYRTRVVDTFWYGRHVFDDIQDHPLLDLRVLDIRETAQLEQALTGIDVVIHLACVSNDPSFELNPQLGKSINYDAFSGLLNGAIKQGVKRFIYASSSSIYGVKDTPDVREDQEPKPLTDYSRFKLDCEIDLLNHPAPNGMDRVIIRPATVCGYAPRLRLDLIVNILTIHALVNRRIRIFGGKQLRPNIHINDMVNAYLTFIAAPSEKIDGEAFNVGYQNRSVTEIAEIVRSTLNDDKIEVAYEDSSDLRSYHVNSDKVREALNFEAGFTIEDAVRSIAEKWDQAMIPDPFSNSLYSNIKRMQELSIR